MKNIHLAQNEKFTQPYIDFVNKNFNANDHLFLIIGKEAGDTIYPPENVISLTKSFKSILFLIKKMYFAEKIFLHGLFIKQIILLLFIQPWLLKKCYWLIWGGDLYYFHYRKRNFISGIYEIVRKCVIKRIGGLITHIKGDYDLAKQWYGARGDYYYSFLYPSNLFTEYDLTKVVKNSNDVFIQVGNSANPSNNHLEAFKMLSSYKEKTFKIICPLSYGDDKYKNKVIGVGKKLYGENFNPITTFLSYNEYIDLLAQIDIAIFNHQRQQALGNITTLLGLGKKVYIRDDITSWDFLKQNGLKVFNVNSSNNIMDPISEADKISNIEKVKKIFSEEKLIKDWNFIFYN